MTAKHAAPAVSYSFTVRVSYPNRVGFMARIAQRISRARGDLGAVDLISSDRKRMTRDFTIHASDESHVSEILKALGELDEVEVVSYSDRVFLLHLGGKISIKNKVPITTRDVLSMAYTPGVARVCEAIAEDPDSARRLTIKGNSVAVVSDGTAVLGLGDIGPAAAMPVMEGKAMLFKEFADIDAYPICLDTKDVDEIVETVVRIAPGFGGINLEDISAPRCFEIEERLRERLDIPVFHDDQHGTAIVVLAALRNAVKLLDRSLKDLRIVVLGPGAAGSAITKILLSAEIEQILVCDRDGILHPGRANELDPPRRWLAEHSNPERLTGDLKTACKGADVFIGVSAPGALPLRYLKSMADDPIVFALSNPDPEISVEEAADHVAVMATGRSDYPNQINNVLAFPGVFRGALDVRANAITEGMKVAAAWAIAGSIAEDELGPEFIIPSVFDRSVAERVATAVGDCAIREGVALKRTR